MNHLKPSIVLLGAHRWNRHSVVEIAKHAGLNPFVLLHSSEELPEELKQTVPHERVLYFPAGAANKAEHIADLISPYAAQWFVIGLDDYVCEFAAELSTYTTKKIMPPFAAHEVLQKHLLRARWNKHCQNNPALFPVPFRLLRYADVGFKNIVAIEDNSQFSESTPLIVKPDALDASIGIHKAASWEEARPAICEIAAEVSLLAREVLSLGIEISPAIIIEHQIPRSERLHPGAEFSAEILSTVTRNGLPASHSLLGVTQKYTSQETFVELCHCFPSQNFPENLRKPLCEVTFRILDELQVQFCISHWEYVVTSDERLALVEAQLRPAGDRIMNLILRSTGIDPYQLLFSALTGNGEFSIPPLLPRRIAAVFFPLPARAIRGKISVICGRATEMILGSKLFVARELDSVQQWEPTTYWYSRYVALVTDGETFNSAKRQCRELLADIMLECRNESGKIEYIPLIMPPL